MKFAGNVGYATQVQVRPGVWEDVIMDRFMRGDLLAASKTDTTSDAIHDSITLGNRFSLIADAFATENFMDIVYVEWVGKKWRVTNVDYARPRLTISIGGVWNGN